MHDDAAEALRALAAEDEAAAFRAEQSLAQLLSGAPAHALPLATIEAHLIDALAVSPDRLRATRDALARFFDHAGLPEAAARCRDGVWEQAADRVAREPERVADVTWELTSRPLIPPQLLDFQWSHTPGPVEAAAWLAVGVQLEAALAEGRLDPAQADWRDLQRSIARAVLECSVPEQTTTWRRAVEHERLTAWLRSRGPGRQALVDVVVDDLLAPPPAPADITAVEPFLWLLELVGDGVDLEGDRLPRAIADKLRQRGGWPRQGRLDRWVKIKNAPEAVIVLAFTTRLLQTVGERALPTDLAASIALDPEALWRHVCRWALAPADPSTQVVEILLLLLLSRPEWHEIDLVSAAKPVAAQEEFLVGRDESTGQLVVLDDSAARSWLHENIDALIALGTALRVVEEPTRRRFRGRRLALTPAGRPTVLALLRGRATGPGVGFSPVP